MHFSFCVAPCIKNSLLWRMDMVTQIVTIIIRYRYKDICMLKLYNFMAVVGAKVVTHNAYLLSLCVSVFVFTIAIKACVWEIKYWLFMTPSNRAKNIMSARGDVNYTKLYQRRGPLSHKLAPQTPETNRNTPRAPAHACTSFSRSTVSTSVFWYFQLKHNYIFCNDAPFSW